MVDEVLQVNYASENMQQDWQQMQSNNDDFSSSYSGDSGRSDGEGEDDEFDSTGDRRRRHRERGDEKLPPLLARVSGQLEVIAFTSTFYSFLIFKLLRLYQLRFSYPLIRCLGTWI